MSLSKGTKRRILSASLVVLLVAAAAGVLVLWRTSAPQTSSAYGLFYREPSRSYDGYTLITPLRGPSVHLLDWSGREIRRWTVPGLPSLEKIAQNPTDFFLSGVLQAKLISNGNLLVGHGEADVAKQQLEGGSMSVLKELDSRSRVVWEYRNGRMHNDFERLHDGTTAVIVWEDLPKEFSRRVQGGIPRTEGGGATEMVSDAIIEIDQDGKELWRWSLKDHLDPVDPQNRLDAAAVRSAWTHLDAVLYLPRNPLTGTPAYLVSVNKLDSLLLIERQSGAILWRWGSGVLAGQHSVALAADGATVITFDNGVTRSHSPTSHGFIRGASRVLFSRVVAVDMRTNTITFTFSPGALEQGRARFYTPLNGTVQALPNGNILVSAGYSGRVFEVDPALNRVVWDYLSPFGPPIEEWPGAVQNAVYSAYRYPAEYVRF